MQWWIAAAGLALLFVFFLSTRKKPFFPRQESFSEETLSAGMAALAEQKLSRRRVRLLLPASERSALEKNLRFLDRLPEDELLPASRCFCENGRYLQEEAAAFAAALNKLYTASKEESRAGFPHFQKMAGGEADDAEE